ncbi:MAG: flagellin [Comamonas sp.]
MAATINTNIASINAQRNLSLSGSSLATSMQRISSGLRINSAKDDAAGLAISERMNTQVRGLTVASRNANDGISLAQTAEGALGKVSDMLQRMRDLSVQAGNATNSKSDREALQSEVKQLSAEIDRVAKTANFNGQKILDGSFAGAVFQVGANSGDNITLGSLADTRSSQLSSVTYGTNSLAGTGAISTTAGDAAANLTLSGYGTAIPDPNAAPAGSQLSISVGTPAGTPPVAPLSIELGILPAASSRQERLGQVVEAINAKSADTGVTAFLSRVDSTDNYEVVMMSNKLGADGKPELVTFDNFTAANSGIDGAAFKVDPTEPTNVVQSENGIENIDVGTQQGAWVALKKIDSAIDQINGARATLGAMQSRFENAVNNIDIQTENLSAARGRIVDADFAQETANLSRTQILQQAGTAMVAQANQLPQQVLKLLQG